MCAVARDSGHCTHAFIFDGSDARSAARGRNTFVRQNDTFLQISPTLGCGTSGSAAGSAAGSDAGSVASSGGSSGASSGAGSDACNAAGSAAGSAASGGTGAIGECGARGEENLWGVRGPSDPI